MVTSVDRYAFIVEWLDHQSGITWKYQLLFFPQTQEIEMHDIKNRRVFLKRTKFPEMKPQMFYVGGCINIYSRHLKITGYSDECTRAKVEQGTERTCAVVKPDGVKNVGKILEAVAQSGLIVSQLRMCYLSKEDAERFYIVHKERPFFEKLTTFMSSGCIVGMELLGNNAVEKWRDMLGPTDSELARKEASGSLRARFGTDGTANACHGSDSDITANEELSFFFSEKPANGHEKRTSSTLGLIKPHIVREGNAGLVIDRIQKNFAITAMQMFTIDRVNAAEFYEVYRGVLNPGEYSGMVDELMSGPFYALEITSAKEDDVVEVFRDLCGPADPELARALRPQTLRAQFGHTKVQNAVHCTDLPEDGELEVSYFFTIMQE